MRTEDRRREKWQDFLLFFAKVSKRYEFESSFLIWLEDSMQTLQIAQKKLGLAEKYMRMSTRELSEKNDLRRVSGDVNRGKLGTRIE